MNLKAILAFLVLHSCAAFSFAQIDGTYTGSLDINGQKLKLIFTIERGKDGSTSGKLDVPAQGAKEVPLSILANTAGEFIVDIPSINAKYAGKTFGTDSVNGTFTQMGYSLPLSLKKIVSGKSTVRPQTPVPPFPYKVVDVTFPGKDKGVTLAGTLSYPEGCCDGSSKPEVVVMVTGSGGQNRDEEILEHKPFAVIADYLARHGIASLRYDDRGVGESTSLEPVDKMTTLDVASDAEAALAYVRQLGEFGKVGILGHSEGGTVAFMLGAKSLPDFIVAMAAPGVRGDKVVMDQFNYQFEQVGNAQRMTREEVIRMVGQKGNKWMDYFLSYEPSEDIKRTTVPVFALNGELDKQVFFPENLNAIEAALPKNKKSLVKSYPGLNHLFQHTETGAPTEYYEIEETISPVVLSDIVTWIKGL